MKWADAKLKIAELEAEVVFWKASYLKAIKHDNRIILKQQEAQHGHATADERGN